MSKQDRQGVRTASDLERKYDLGKGYDEIVKIATNAQRTASSAQNTANNANSTAESAKTTADGMATRIEELNERINSLEQSGGVALDTTLTKAGQAADAKAVGDALANKLSASDLPSAVNDALAQAKASGEFDGKDGYTPTKGVDYFTAADKAGLVNDVLAALPVYSGEYEGEEGE